MKLILSRHARQRVAERSITLDDIWDVLTATDRMSVPGGSAKVCYIGTTTAGRRLKVCLNEYIEDASPVDGRLTVVTVHWYDR